MRQQLRDRLTGARPFGEFLPDAEGIVERGHSPVAGVLILSITAAFAGLLGWSALTEVEQVVLANGQVEPAGRVKIVNHPDGGRIAEVHVVEGQRVVAGAPLLTFDPELVTTQLAELTGRFEVKSAEAARLQAELTGGELLADAELGAARPALVDEQRQLLESRRQVHASRAAELAQTVLRRRSEVASIAAELVRLRNGQALLSEQLDAIRGLAEKGLYPRLRLAAVERQHSDLTGESSQTRARREAAEAALAEAESRQEGLEREWRSTLLAELSEVSAERDRLAEARKRQLATVRNLVVRAPVDGIVQELAVTTPGQSVGSNQPLMKVIPTGGGLVIEARVANQDIGYIRVGQPVTVKVQAYDFLRFGTLSGAVERIAADAALDPRSGALTYGIMVRTDGAELGKGADRFSVVPGMAVEVDLLVGERTILSYLTDRIFRLQQAAFREG
jgi:HlyD family type I secretion membrane fusion protein